MDKINSVMKINKVFPSTTEGNVTKEQAEITIYYKGAFLLTQTDRIYLIEEEWKNIGKVMGWKQ